MPKTTLLSCAVMVTAKFSDFCVAEETKPANRLRLSEQLRAPSRVCLWIGLPAVAIACRHKVISTPLGALTGIVIGTAIPAGPAEDRILD